MKMNEQYKTSIISALFGVGMLFLFFIGREVPPRHELANLEGKIEWVKATGKYKDNFRFKFIGNKTHLIYNSIGGYKEKVQSALLNKEAIIGVLYDHTDSHSPPLDDNFYHNVYELNKDDSSIRGYQSMVESYKKNNQLAGWMCLGSFIIAGIYFIRGKGKKSN